MKKKTTEPFFTDEDRIPLLYGKGSWHFHGIPEKGIPEVECHDGPLGLRYRTENEDSDPGILLSNNESTCFPAPALLACSFDEKVIESVGKALGQETARSNSQVILAPGLNIKRNPLCGRNFEYFSEDPLVSGYCAAAYVRGVQFNGVAACIKHFACNSQETNRLISDSIVDERTLQEIYLKGFGIAIRDGDPWTLMGSYNLINGQYACSSEHIMHTVLREQFGFKGVAMSDWGAVEDSVSSHNTIDIEMPCYLDYSKRIAKGLKNKDLRHDRFIEATDRVIELAKKTSNPVIDEKFSYEKNHKVAVNAVVKSCVLLKNDRNLLPLDDLDDACVIGAFAKYPRYQGNGSSLVNPKHLVSFLEVVNSKRKGNPIPYCAGYSIERNDTGDYLFEARDLAQKHKKIIVFLGIPSSYESEGFDRDDMKLPDDQLKLIDVLAEENKNVIVVLSVGAPVELPFAEKVNSILLTYLSGEGGAEGTYELLMGHESPSGKLPETWPIHYYDVPNHEFYPGKGRQALYREGLYVGYRYYTTVDKKVAFPFGHGLSYAKFKYGKLRLSKAEIKSGNFKARVEVSNVSDVDSEVVVEVYSRQPKHMVVKPLRELRAFKKVLVKANSTKDVEINVEYDDLAHWDSESRKFVVEPGEYVIEIGESCVDIVASAKIRVKSDFVPKDEKQNLYEYYVPSSMGMNVSDRAFEELLGHKLDVNAKDWSKKPYTLANTLEDIQGTFIGRIIKKEVFKRLSKNGTDEATLKMHQYMAMTSPMRIMVGVGVTYHQALAVVALANGKPFRAIAHLMGKE